MEKKYKREISTHSNSLKVISAGQALPEFGNFRHYEQKQLLYHYMNIYCIIFESLFEEKTHSDINQSYIRYRISFQYSQIYQFDTRIRTYLRIFSCFNVFINCTSFNILFLFALCLFFLRTITFPMPLWTTWNIKMNKVILNFVT